VDDRVTFIALLGLFKLNESIEARDLRSISLRCRFVPSKQNQIVSRFQLCFLFIWWCDFLSI